MSQILVKAVTKEQQVPHDSQSAFASRAYSRTTANSQLRENKKKFIAYLSS